MGFDSARVKQLFLAASDLASPQERAAYLDRECQGDLELRARIEALLAADADAAGKPEVSLSSSAQPDVSTDTGVLKSPLSGLVLAGKYKLIERIGEGGMGIVWLAQQSEPVKRKVAVKLIKLGMDSRQVIGRFEAERQALAMMDHPNIARVLDGGIAPDGRPFFVMELVKGTPITQYCDSCKLSLEERLNLFVPVCQAIQHAHQKGIIHRDIKPGNVLIALYDDRPVPKVIDFGVAKATGGALTDVTLSTGFGGVVGTPQYMSPEQATLNNLDIDTRSDVYSLGILLYELLAGSPPFAKHELEKRGLLEMLRVVREEDPPKPSTRLSSADALPSLSANRSIEPRKLTQLLRSELDWVVLKAIEKKRTRRYETASGFAADITRYLAGEPVLAHPPSTAYRLRKFIRRHRAQVVAALLVVFALLVGLAGTAYGLHRANHFAAAERVARERAEAGEKAIAVRDAALNNAEELFNFFRLVFQGPDPLRGNITVLELIERTARTLDSHFASQPDEKAGLQAALGGFAYKLGFIQQAVSLQEKVRDFRLATAGPDSPFTLDAMNNLAVSYHVEGRQADALTIWKQVLDRSSRLYGPEDPRTVMAMNNLAFGYDDSHRAQTIALLETVVQLDTKNAGPEDPLTLDAKDNLAHFYGEAGRFTEALELEQKVLDTRQKNLGPEDPATITALNNLASLSARAHRQKKETTIAQCQQVLDLRTKVLGPEHPDTIDAMGNLASAYAGAGHYDQAFKLWEDALVVDRKLHGSEHAATINAMLDLANGYFTVGRLADALRLYQEALTSSRQINGPENAMTIKAMFGAATSESALGDHPAAIELMQQAVERSKASAGLENRQTLLGMSHLGHLYANAGQLDKAIEMEKQVLPLSQKVNGAEDRETLTIMRNLGHSYYLQKQNDDAVAVQTEVLQLSRRFLGLDDPDTLIDMNNLAATFARINRLSDAITLEEQILPLCLTATAPEKKFRLTLINNLAVNCFNNHDYARASGYLRQQVAAEQSEHLSESDRAKTLAFFGLSLVRSGAFLEAEAVLRQCLDIRRRLTPEDWKTFSTESLLGEALCGEQKYDEAGKRLLNGYTQMKKRESAIPAESKSRLTEAVDQLVMYYTRTEQPDEAAKWRAERAAYPGPTGPTTQQVK
jgi:serine/threonine protein kinase/tetratricopeptide (TPR) repeat protein